jgi:hypothetical protein
MGNRVSASFTIGGVIPRALIPELVELIELEGLGVDWDGPTPTAEDFVTGPPLFLAAYEVNGGAFEDLATFCVANKIPYSNAYDGYCSEWSEGRSWFDGANGSDTLTCNNGVPVMTRQEAVYFVDKQAILDEFDRRDFAVPDMVITDE